MKKLFQKNRKRIGVLCRKSPSGEISASAAYMNWANTYGRAIPIFALDDVVHTNLDILILIGGADVNPARYMDLSEGLNYTTGNSDIQLEWFDQFMLPKYIEQGTKILGICRGFQTLNVAFGGILEQDIDQDYSGTRGELKDTLELTEEGRNYLDSEGLVNNILPHIKSDFKVNTLHHQGFFEDQCGEDVVPLFINKEYKNVEVFVVSGRPIFGVQYHPEEIGDQLSFNIMNYLLSL